MLKSANYATVIALDTFVGFIPAVHTVLVQFGLVESI